MHQHQTRFTISTEGQALYEFTREVEDWIGDTGIDTGLITLFCRHTSASLLINENAAPAVQRDLLRWLSKAAPESDAYEHDDEGPDDMPAHIRTMLTGASLSIPVSDGRMALGTWQGIYLAEHRAMPHRREIVAHLLGERVSEV
ncbi:secondary thiamine-phosphate synthase enzyme YjbQ [Aurantiacibacter sp. MUD61]|uniref:secondary thiamine-phosphate synthase enzyme YjbQ n=1 Tax=Aurantiacibacter sp. MUD61 TaxID=3009083 RepID=UPI0022F0F80F|nr:secondary thiamine-phosphate synthase enzyme YjbQ [Aurantiacibacter sp. MUD61]